VRLEKVERRRDLHSVVWGHLEGGCRRGLGLVVVKSVAGCQKDLKLVVKSVVGSRRGLELVVDLVVDCQKDLRARVLVLVLVLLQRD
jgi:hypothetical protein